ncbi:uncharacterized protein LOC112043765 [Bicyclus anynana]|uniref:Uncharacterized protein LOC112043765 n=1 Tax=Bicyclus anynana TaxID=110368 RepID=A0ABM3LMV5_BICAN|nr:uncharacterized protein LOC112043765 [Bicyclus anynana]
MAWTVIAVLAIFLVETQSYQPFKVFEIRKAKNYDQNIDDQYYDTDFARIQSAIHREKDDRRLQKLAEDIVKRLLSLPRREKYGGDSDTRSVDDTRNVIVIPSQDTAYQTRPAEENIIQKLIQSALRSGDNDAEDRTAAPMHRVKYDTNDY